jgi:hypothetical protein
VRGDPRSIVREYFERMRARDVGVVDLFAEDAVLLGIGSRRSGRDAIREFYGSVIEGAGPTPRLVGELLCHGSRVAAEIEIGLPGGASLHVVDLFEVDDTGIRSLTYFVANHPPDRGRS